MIANSFLQYIYYVSMFNSLFLHSLKRQLESVTHVFMFRAVLANLKISEPTQQIYSIYSKNIHSKYTMKYPCPNVTYRKKNKEMHLLYFLFQL